jgi:hypothetical protein
MIYNIYICPKFKIKINMRKLLLILITISVSSIVFGQECKSYFPQEIGKKYEYSDLDKKGKLLSTSIKTVVNKKTINGGIEVSIKEESKNVDVDTSTTIEYTIKCENGVMFVDMESILMNQEQMQAYQEMEVKVTADDLSIPENVKAGDDLGGGNVVADVYNQGMKMVSINLTVSDRKVAALESITTDAGTFDCIKITSKMQMKLVMNFTYNLTEWYSKDIGIVKSETYNKKGKIMGSLVLTKIE